MCIGARGSIWCSTTVQRSRRQIRLRSVVGPAIKRAEIANSPGKRRWSCGARNVTGGPTVCNSIPFPPSNTRIRSQPSKRENGPSASTSATDSRQSNSAESAGKRVISRVHPPPLRHGSRCASLSGIRRTTKSGSPRRSFENDGVLGAVSLRSPCAGFQLHRELTVDQHHGVAVFICTEHPGRGYCTRLMAMTQGFVDAHLHTREASPSPRSKWPMDRDGARTNRC
ncbi:unannotated protein [freshwater metagenome]|uniref:Unannotated protein n=1 Tax=freshwater metagenome TaxID=449393 RepID=A0A6J6ZJR6_9ZZZZ